MLEKRVTLEFRSFRCSQAKWIEFPAGAFFSFIIIVRPACERWIETCKKIAYPVSDVLAAAKFAQSIIQQVKNIIRGHIELIGRRDCSN